MAEQKTKILLAEDDPNLGSLLKEYLEAKSYETTLAVNGKEASQLLKKNSYDLCLLDIMMPYKDGFTLAKEIRTTDKDIPIVFLTAKSMKEDTIEGFKIGADDYITKPFSMEELLLRINAILKRAGNKQQVQEKNLYQIGKYTFDFNHQLLKLDDKEQKLTTREAQLLKLLCVNVNEVLDRTFALKAIWEDDNYFNGRSMDVYITRLRKYLKDDPSIEIINVHGKGFKLRVS